MLAAFCIPTHAAAPPTGTPIDNIAYFELKPNITLLKSNLVRALVQPIESLTLVSDQQAIVSAGSSATFVHHLTNNGNTGSSVSLTLTTPVGNGFTIANLTLYRSLNNTGVLASGDPVISPANPLTLNSGESVTLIVTGTVPSGTTGGLAATIRISAATDLQKVSVANTDVINVELPAVPPVIDFFTDKTFSRIALSAIIGDDLNIQATAAMCNTDPLVAEKKTVTLTSTLSGDTETFDAVETGPNTGIFRIISIVLTRDAGINPAVKGNGTMEVLKNDQLTATINGCGSASAVATILVDPFGVIFDSKTGVPVDGATVTIVDASGHPAVVKGEDGVCDFPSTITSGTVVKDSSGKAYTFPPGGFWFPRVPSGTYRLQVLPPNGYSFPSKVSSELLPTGHTIDRSGSYGGTFQVTTLVRMDVPVDTAPLNGLFVEKTASVSTAEMGDFVDYSIKTRNGSGRKLTQLTIRDTLPAGFSYLPGSTRLTGHPIPDPDGGRGPAMVFPVGDLDDGADVTFTYRVKIGPGAFEGNGINYARAFDASGNGSNLASALVKVSGGVFSDKGFIIGKVFTDCNRNRVQDPEELGIPGVRLFMEDGTFVTTDSEGKFSLYGISPRTHILKIDTTSLPAGAELIDLSNRNAGDAGSLFIDMKSGELFKANFAEGSCNSQVMKEVKARRAKHESANAESDLTLAKPLAFVAVPVTQSDVRALPSSGLVGSANAAPAVSPAPVENAAPLPAMARGQKAAPPVKVSTLEDELVGADKTIDFLNLKDQDILPVAQTPIRLKGPANGKLKLLVNGEEVSEKQLGTKIVDSERQIESREYIGIALKPGSNKLQILLIDPFGNQRGEKTIKVNAPGKLSKVTMSVPDREFAADGQTPLPVTVRLFDENGLPFKIKMSITLDTSLGKWVAPDLDEKEPGTQVIVEGGSAEFLLIPPTEPGESLLKISANNIKEETKVYFFPNLRPIIAAGIVEGTINLRNLGSSALSPARAQDGFEQEIRNYGFSGDNGKLQGGARAAMYLKGKIKGDYLLTLSYDSDKDSKTGLFRDIQPDQFYPVYGDSSVKGFDAQSTGKLYVRIDKNKSYLLYGDFTTPTGGEVRMLGAYNRSLNGIMEHYENSFVRANAFASRDSSSQVIDEIPAMGLSGPYFLTKVSSFVSNSEKVEIITRDRNQPSLVLKSVPQARFSDYEIEELSGRILFKMPVPTLDPDMNPNFIRVTYETDQGGDKFWVAGGDAQVKLHKRLEVGASYVKDENPLDKADLKSANATIKLFDKTFLIGEWAQSFKESIGRGDAERFELRHDGDKLQARLYGVRTDPGFDNPGSSFGKGRKEAGAKLTYKATPTTTISGEALHSEDVVAGGKKDGLLVNIQQNINKSLQAEFGVRHSHETTTPAQPGGPAVTPNDVTSLRAKLTGKIPQFPKLSLTGEYEQSLSYGDRRMAAGGAEYQLSTVGKLYARHEFISSLSGPYNLNGSQQQNSTLVGIDTEYRKDGKVFSEYRVRDALDGRDAEAAIGLKNGWVLAKGIKLNTTLERIQKLGGATDNTATAVTGALEYTASPLWKGTVRLEYRAGTTSNNLLNTIGLAYKMNRNVTLLGRQFLSFTDNKGTSGNIIQERFQAGIAYRPTDTDTWNVLARYEFKYEDNGNTTVPAPLSTTDLSAKRTVHIVSAHLNYQPTKALTMSAHYAGKLVSDTSNGLSGTSNTHLLSGRTIYDLTSKWDAGLNYSALFSDFFKSCQYGLGGEIGHLVATNLWLSGGYNIFGFKDKDLGAEEYTAQGVYLRIRYKFDEDLFSGNDPKANKTLPMKLIAKADQ
jgi:uncharacterized repeat protein (TIGR01451 family)